MSTSTNIPTASGARISLCDARGPIGTLFDALSGDGGHQWLRALNKFLRKESPWEWFAKDFPTWHTLHDESDKGGERYGPGLLSFETFAAALRFRCEMDKLSEGRTQQEMAGLIETLNGVHFTGGEVRLSVLNYRDIGLEPDRRRADSWPTYDQLCKKVLQMGFDLCPQDTVPRLWRNGSSTYDLGDNAIAVTHPVIYRNTGHVLAHNRPGSSPRMVAYEIDKEGMLVTQSAIAPLLIVAHRDFYESSPDLLVEESD